MNATTTIKRNWYDANQSYLSASLALVRYFIEIYIAKSDNESVVTEEEALKQALEPAAAAMPQPSALDKVCNIFGLSNFECNILLMCASMEFSADFGGLCAAAQGDTQQAYPTLSLALAALPDAHWDAIAPHAPLRRWGLIDVGEGKALTLCPLRINERILHYLIGTEYIDEQLNGIIEPMKEVGYLVSSHQELSEQISLVWKQAPNLGMLTAVQLCGPQPTTKWAIAVDVCK